LRKTKIRIKSEQQQKHGKSV